MIPNWGCLLLPARTTTHTASFPLQGRQIGEISGGKELPPPVTSQPVGAWARGQQGHCGSHLEQTPTPSLGKGREERARPPKVVRREASKALTESPSATGWEPRPVSISWRISSPSSFNGSDAARFTRPFSLNASENLCENFM